jgi:NAD(P)-dependent dehydrogenase (short-subunit alcohol dehydrogenase family)
MTVDGVDEARVLGCGSALHFVQELAGATDAPRMWFITRQAQRFPGDTTCEVGQAPVWGFGRTLAVEHAELWGGLIDLDAVDADSSAALLYDEITLADADDQIVFRQGRRFVARLTRSSVADAGAAPAWRSDATYAITGGFGGLGLEVARWMVDQGARRLLLIGRSSLPARAEWTSATLPRETARRVAAIRELESRGAAVHLATVDVGDAAAMHTFLRQFRADGWPPIRGVVHAAGIMQYEPMAAHSLTAMTQIHAAKARGAWILHQLLVDPVPDFFVCFSSASALLSSPLLASYAAANCFLDALAQLRRSQGLPALSINWGLWSEVGMVARFTEEERRGPSAIGRTITPPQGLKALKHLMSHGVTNAAVIPVDWQEWARLYGGFMNAPFLSRVLLGSAAQTQSEVSAAPKLRETITEADPKERISLLRFYVAERVGGVVGMMATTVEQDQPITTMGLDSLMAVELKNRIEADLQVVVPIVQLLQGPTVETLAEDLLKRLDSPVSAADTLAGAATDSVEEGDI